MPNKFQVKRTSTSGRTPNTTNSGNSQYIDAGEFALNMADRILYTSNGSVLIPVGANNANVNVTNQLTANSIIAGKVLHSPVEISRILTGFDSADSDTFSRIDISKDGSTLAVGAWGWEGTVGTGRGGVYIYDWNGSNWIQRGSVLEAADAADSDGFGFSVSLSSNGSILAVGLPNWEGASGTDRGGVYIYDWSGSAWVQRGSVIEAADAADSDGFGVDVSLSDDGAILVVGANTWEGATGTGRGGVYIYDWNGSSWVQRGSVLEAADAADNDAFGISVSISSTGSILAVGANTWEGATGSNRGGVYIYDWSGSAWVQRGSVLEASDAADSDAFGRYVSLSSDGSILAVSAFTWEGATGTNRGGVYIYDWNGSSWVQRGSVLEADDAADTDQYGVSVSICKDGSILAVGSQGWEGSTGTSRGAVYTYTLDGTMPGRSSVATGSGWIEGTSSALVARTAGLDRITLDANGNVGIGETNPLRKLTVRGDSAGSLTVAAFYNADTTANNGSVFSFRSDTTGTGAATFQEFAAITGRYENHDHATRSGGLDFYTVENGTGATRVSFVANGNVGIGNTTPNAKLQVTGTANVSGNVALGGDVRLDNDKNIYFKTVNTSASVGMRQQNDDNFVFYTTNTLYGQRPVWSIFANSDTSALSISTPTIFNANINLGGVSLTANGTTGSAGQVLSSNGTATYWASPGAASVDLAAQYAWTNTHTFSANVAFTGNNISLVTNTSSIMFAGSTDTNWRIGRNTGTASKFFYTNNTLDIIAAGSPLEGVSIGQPGANSYLETGYAGTFTRLPIYVGNSSVNVTINATSFTGTALTANNASFLGGTAAASFVQNTDSRTLSGNLVYSGTYHNPSSNTVLLGNSIQRWVISGNSGDFSSTVNAVTSVNSALLSVGTTFIANTTGAYHTGTVNAASHTVGSSFIANATAIVGTGFANITTSVNSALLTVGTSFIANTTGAYHTGVVNAASHTVGATFTANATLVNAAAINITGQVNTATLYAATSANIASAVQANATGVYTTGTVNAASLTVGTSTIANSLGVYTGVVNAASHTVGSSFIANATAIVGTGYANITTSVNSALLTVGTSFIANTTGAYHTGTVNAVSLTVGTSTIANSLGVYTGVVNAASHTVGTAFTANSTVVNAVSYYSGSLLIANSTVSNATHLGGYTWSAPAALGGGTANTGAFTTLTTSSTALFGGYTQIAGSASQVGIKFTGSGSQYGLAIQPASDGTTMMSFFNAAGSVVGTITQTATNLVYNGSGASFTQTNTATLYATTSVNVASAVQANATGVYTTGTMNAASHTVGSSFIANTTGAYHTGIVNAASHTTTGITANATGVYPASNTTGTALGSSTQRWVINANTINGTGDWTTSANVGIGTAASATYRLQVNGAFAATTKSFLIDHPTKPDMKLRYGSLEGPENGVYVRGRANTNTIELPEYWMQLVDENSITVNLTAIGKKQDLYVKSVVNNVVTVAGSKTLDYFYVVLAERKDVDKLVVEF